MYLVLECDGVVMEEKRMDETEIFKPVNLGRFLHRQQVWKGFISMAEEMAYQHYSDIESSQTYCIYLQIQSKMNYCSPAELGQYEGWKTRKKAS